MTDAANQQTPYNPTQVEQQAQQFWLDNQSFAAQDNSNKEKFYCLSMFPYPSGKLHMGHVRNYCLSDVIARFQKMRGKNVLHPMGWDAFGLPAENAAIQNKTAPAKWTYQNIDHMKHQLNSLGFSFDWTRELATCQPSYYKWEQWFFTRLYEKGLVYRKMSSVNWDPVDQTVLANEQVIDGRGWRSGAVVERREIPQWFIKITDYAEELIDSLDDLTEWPEQVRTMQKNWIGKSKGMQITFNLPQTIVEQDSIEVYTTRPDTLMGTALICVAAEHPIAVELAKDNAELTGFIKKCKEQSVNEADMSTMEKNGIATGLHCIHPLTGKMVPIWVANYVLMDYGSGAVMSVPAHDLRDWDFAKKYQIPFKQVIRPSDTSVEIDISVAAFTDKGTLCNSGEYDGLDFNAAFAKISDDLSAKNQGHSTDNYRLRDWGVSRQRYWGSPIPMLNLPEGGEVPVPLNRLPVLLPEDVVMDGVTSPIKADLEWCKTSFNGEAAKHETDTFDTFMQSSWYYARYTCPDFEQGMLDSKRANYWLPVDQYVGGIEHAILHLLYARFFHKLMRDEGLIECDEPFKRLLCQGMVLADSYYEIEKNGNKVWHNPKKVDVERDDKGRIISASFQGKPVQMGGMIKMSKSKNNGIDPHQAIEQYGADTVRLFTMFAAPPEQTLEWSDEGVQGSYRFLNRLWTACNSHVAKGAVEVLNVDFLTREQKNLRRKTHQTIEKVTDDYSRRLTFNTAIAAVMELINTVNKLPDENPQSVAVEREALSAAIVLLAPCVPHICHTLWALFGNTESVIDAKWPEFDSSALIQDSITYVVQVNGKLRASLEFSVDASKDQIKTTALADENVQRFLQNLTVRKVIVVPKKLINIVAN